MTLPERAMAKLSKMSELQDALNRYGEASVQNYKIVHPIGEKVIKGFGDYLGEAGCVFGVPPAGDWQNDGRNYNDAKFSTFWEGALKVGTISMGLSVRIPHTKDDGALWLRIVLDFFVEGDAFSVGVGDGGTIKNIPLNNEPRDLLPVYDEIFSYAKGIFANPVDYFAAERAGKIGFLSSQKRSV
jgi:hypothetical protein